MSEASSYAPIIARLIPDKLVQKAISYDATLVAMERVILAGFAEDDVREMQDAIMHAYTMRIGAIIAGRDPAGRDSLLHIAQEQMADAADLYRMVRS